MADFTAWVEKNRSLWTRVYDEVIAPDFEEEWKKREQKHLEELKKRDENQQLLFNHINEQIVKTAKAVEENEKLETELQQRAESTASPTNTTDVSVPGADTIAEQHQELCEKYDELTKKYQDLSQKVKYLERKNSAVMQKNRDMKDSVRAWQQYADRQKPQQKRSAARAEEGEWRISPIPRSDDTVPVIPSSPRSVNTVRTPIQRADCGRSSPAPEMLHETHADRAAGVSDEEEHLPSDSITPRGPTATRFKGQLDATDDDLSSAPVQTQNHTKTNTAPSSSQTTVDEVVDQFHRRTQPINGIDDDDLPQIVSERSLKRKRGQQSRIDAYTGRSSGGTPAKPLCVKDEPLSSPPAAMHVLKRTETIDLDDAAAHPQKPSSIHSRTKGTIRHQRSGSAPLSQAVREHAAQIEQSERDQTSNVHIRPQLTAAEMRAVSEPMGHQPNDQHILQPLDLNIIAHTTEQTPTKLLKQTPARRLKHNVLAESGEAAPPVDEEELRLPPSAARANLQRIRASNAPHTPANRVQRYGLSGSPLVKQEQTPPSSTRTSRHTPSGTGEASRSALNARTDQQDDIVPDGRPVWGMRASDKRPNAPRRSLPSTLRQSPLREKPVRELRVHDFKPNPVYNHGYTYAFSETVRKRGDRMCLPGCTNAECCGSDFRRLAEALDELPASQEEAILEEYLGDAYDTVVSTQMSPDERAELVLQARTKKIAKESGKHREAYERRRTPPGYWRVDFPSTQEQQRDRERAKEQEIKTVQERWLEAQKKGGRWVFRDE
ncbi:hypothetical protein G6514_010027 [Epicoccum nigrum]|nr:hypothetical protein G6514_010027 [Epicoccum nigrum]